MTIFELTEIQQEQVKIQLAINRGDDLSYLDMVNINNIVSDEEIISEYADIVFVEEDFI